MNQPNVLEIILTELDAPIHHMTGGTISIRPNPHGPIPLVCFLRNGHTAIFSLRAPQPHGMRLHEFTINLAEPQSIDKIKEILCKTYIINKLPTPPQFHDTKTFKIFIHQEKSIATNLYIPGLYEYE